MRFVPIDRVVPGMVIGTDILDDECRVLIGSPTPLSELYIKRLKQYGFDGVYIDDEYSQDIEIEPTISPVLRKEGMRCVKRMDIDACTQIAKNIVKELLEKGTVSFELADLRSYDNYTYAHSVNVAVLCCVIGMGLNMNESELETLVMAALFHDFGKMEIPIEVLNKPTRLTAEEFALIQAHPMRSYEILSERWDINTYVKTAVRSHHENVDGTGYPDGLKGDKQTIYMKVLHTADAYDALTARRPYKKAYSSQEALEYLMGNCGRLYDLDVVRTLMNYIPQYPKGTEIILSDGRRGVVVQNSGDHNLRPIVRLFDDRSLLDLTDMDNLNLTLTTAESEISSVSEQEERERQKMFAKARSANRPNLYS